SPGRSLPAENRSLPSQRQAGGEARGVPVGGKRPAPAYDTAHSVSPGMYCAAAVGGGSGGHLVGGSIWIAAPLHRRQREGANGHRCRRPASSPTKGRVREQ